MDWHHPVLAESLQHGVEIRGARRREGLEEAMRALEHRARAFEAASRHQGGADAGLRGPAGMHAFCRCAFGEILDDARGHAAGDAEGGGDLLRRQLQRGGDTARGGNGADHRGGVKAGGMDRARRHQAQPAHQFGADDDATQQGRPAQAFAFAGGQDGRHDHGAGMNRAAFEGVVVVLAVRGGAVDQRGIEGTEAAGVAERGAGAARIGGRQGGGDVALVTACHTEPEDVEHQPPRHLGGGVRQFGDLADPLPEPVGDRGGRWRNDIIHAGGLLEGFGRGTVRPVRALGVRHYGPTAVMGNLAGGVSKRHVVSRWRHGIGPFLACSID